MCSSWARLAVCCSFEDRDDRLRVPFFAPFALPLLRFLTEPAVVSASVSAIDVSDGEVVEEEEEEEENEVDASMMDASSRREGGVGGCSSSLSESYSWPARSLSLDSWL